MDPKHLHTLEFPKVLERLAHHTDFSASRELALALVPAFSLSEVRGRQAETSEARRLLSIKPDVSIGGARDVRPLLKQARLSAALLPDELLDIRQTVVSAVHLKRAITRLGHQFPNLVDVAGGIQECPDLVQEVTRCISDRGEVLDSASPALARIRSELGVVHQRLLNRLNKIVHSPRNDQYLQETFVTQRQGRYVIPLRAEFKGRIRGIVHDQSASGATLFIEPLATVELNNQWRELQLDEEGEVRRVLRAITDLVARESGTIAAIVEALAKLDLAFAKAKYADELRAVEPEWAESGDKRELRPAQTHAPSASGDSASPSATAEHRKSIQLLVARHPLLDSKRVVPIDVVLPSETHILIVTGPNTGGKTVTLKTVGLLVAMAQAGLHIPAAEGTKLPLFQGIYADIGDEQSIEQSLSTFSSHLTNIVGILAECDGDSLVLLDELGAGTDPVEGSGLAQAILDNLRERRVTTFVATHYSELKAYGHAAPGAVNASVEFDVETLAPTYRLAIGLPGRSNAFAIASRLGLDEGIIRAARRAVSPEAMRTEAMLQDIQAQLDVATREGAAAEALRSDLEARLESLNQRLATIDDERRDILNSARADALREIRAVRRELRRLRQDWIAGLKAAETREPGFPGQQESEKAAEAALVALEATVGQDEAPSSLLPRHRGQLRPGDRVWIEHFQAVGEVIRSHREVVEVQLGRFRTSLKRDQVDLHKQGLEAETPRGEGESGSSGVFPSTAGSPGLELDLRGQTTEEALNHLDLYLDDAFLVGLPWVRIIHGKGTGALRAAVRKELRGHPMIASFEPGREGEGGDGVTVAKLALE